MSELKLQDQGWKGGEFPKPAWIESSGLGDLGEGDGGSPGGCQVADLCPCMDIWVI